MNIYVTWSSDIENRKKLAATGNKPEEVRKLSFAAEKANMVVESWLLTAGGKLIGYEGSVGSAEVPADRLAELPDLREKFESAVDGRCFMGVGTDLSEATRALVVARKRGGSHSIVFYTPDLHEEAEEPSEGSTENSPGDLTDEDALLLEQPMGKADFGAQPSAGEATQVASGAMSPSAAQPSPLPMPGPSALPSADPSAQDPSAGGAPAAPPPNTGQADKSSKLKEAVVGVLKDIRAQTPTFEKMKEENPKAYEAVMELVQAFLGMAKEMLKQNGQPVQKSTPVEHRVERLKERRPDLAHKFEPSPEETPEDGKTLNKENLATEAAEEHLEHPWTTTAQADQIAADHERLGKDALPATATPGAKGVTQTGHHNLVLPPGSMHNGRIKVIHSDGSMSWSSQRSGRVPADAGGAGGDAMTGHSMPSRHPSDSHTPSGEEANNPVAAQVKQ